MRAERPCPVQPPADGSSANEESSPSWASCSSTPSYATTGLAFEFSHKCTISEESLRYLSTSSDQLNSVPLSPTDPWFANAASASRLQRSSRASCDGKLGAEPQHLDGAGPCDENPSASGSKLSHFLKRTQSVAPPAHALFMRKVSYSSFGHLQGCCRPDN